MSNYALPSELTAVGMEMVFNPRYGLRALANQTVSAAPATWFGANLPTAPTTFVTTSAPPAAANTNRGSYYTPGVGGDSAMSLQTAIDDAAAASGSLGDVIVLQAGTTYTTTTSFQLRNNAGSGTVYIISSEAPEIGGSGLPAIGTRVSPSNIANMPSLRTSTTTAGGYLIQSDNASHGYRLVGLDLELQDINGTGRSSCNYVAYLAHGDTSSSTLDSNITFDRCYVAGAPTLGASKGIQADGGYIEICNCYFWNIFAPGNGDSNAIWAINGPGPLKITNNFLFSDGETVFTGGDNITVPNAMVSDIDIENNHFYKSIFNGTGSVTASSTTLAIASVTGGSGLLLPPMTITAASGNIPQYTTIIKQLTGTTGGAGTYQMSAAATGNSGTVGMNGVPTGKNMIEFKEAKRVLIKNNFFENAGAQGQPRSAFTATVRNQYNQSPWVTISDLHVENNIFTNAQFGSCNFLIQDSQVAQSTGDTGGDTQICQRWLFRNDLFILSKNDDSSGTAFMILLSNLPASQGGNSNGGGGGGTDIIFDHCTWVNTTGVSSGLYFGGAQTGSLNMALQRVVFSNNIWSYMEYLFGGATHANQGYAAGLAAQASNLAFLKNVVAGVTDSTLPSSNANPSTNAAIGFTSFGSAIAAAGYALASSSAYYQKGVNGSNQPYTSAGIADSTDIGCNINLLPTS